jgi:hypothetical protein
MTTHFFFQIGQTLSRLLLWIMLVASLYPSFGVAQDRAVRETLNSQPPKYAGSQVGRVTLMLGKAFLSASGQANEELAVGSSIKVGDLVTTSSNGHVHIQFDDNAYVSIRPNSRLEVVRYDYDRDRPEMSSVKFNLQEGVTRAISGKAAKSARDQFRLNTPIAAIGVRGTDFVVSATETTVRALVNEGVIVMAPFSDECSAAAFGPCGKDAVELAGASMQILEQDGIAALPRLIPSPLDLPATGGGLQLASAGESNTSEGTAPKQDLYRETANLTREAIQAETIASTQTAPAKTDIKEPDTGTQGTEFSDFTPDVPLTVAEVKERQLVWGRFSFGNSTLNQMTLSFADASTDRKATVGNFDFALFRSETPGQDVERGLGVIDFQLSSAQAQYNSESGVVAMQVSGGSLSVDFQEYRFATELNMNHVLTGPINFAASGSLFNGGYFYNTTESQRIAGAVSFDGKEAGYFFEQQLQFGNIKGLTLWDNP